MIPLKIEILEITDTHARFIVDGVHPYFVNALRRTLAAEVPKLAIDKVTFYDNTSALFDEIVAHRLGLLPIPTDPATLNRKGEVDADGNPAYVVRYTLTKEGPCTVYSGDMEPEDKAFAVADPKIPIVHLLEGQRLILEAEAILGDGTEHAKWQACQAVGYKYYPMARIDNRKIGAELAQEAIEKTPTGILGLDGNKLVVLDELNVNKADAVGALRDADGTTLREKDAFVIDHDDRRFVMRFETDGALKAEDALLKAVELLRERFKAFQDATADI